MGKYFNFRANLACGLIFAFLLNSLGPLPVAQADEFPLPQPGILVHLSPEFTPALLKGIVIHPENAFKFDFIVYKGDKAFTNSQKKQEYTKLIKYFLASLAVPDEDQWVNLSPYEKNRIIKDDFGKTEMGRDLLAQDYLLKQITASLIYPQDKLGQEFWDAVYSRAYKQFGTTNIPVNTFNKVWIIPDDADIYEKGNVAYLYKSHLKVMLEEDYLAIKKNQRQPGGSSDRQNCRQAGCQANEALNVKATQSNSVNALGSNVVRQIILPQLEKEVNEDKNFAPLRQVFSAMILAAWYKRALRESLLAKIYANKDKLKGVDQNPKNNEAIYQQYLKAYKKGVFNFIKEDVDKYTNETIPRKYFSGGTALIPADAAMGPDGLREAKFLHENLPDAAMKAAQDLRSGQNLDLTQVSVDPNQNIPVEAKNPDAAMSPKAVKEQPLAVAVAQKYIEYLFSQALADLKKEPGINKGSIDFLNGSVHSKVSDYVLPNWAQMYLANLLNAIKNSGNLNEYISNEALAYELLRAIDRIEHSGGTVDSLRKEFFAIFLRTESESHIFDELQRKSLAFAHSKIAGHEDKVRILAKLFVQNPQIVIDFSPVTVQEILKFNKALTKKLEGALRIRVQEYLRKMGEPSVSVEELMDHLDMEGPAISIEKGGVFNEYNGRGKLYTWELKAKGLDSDYFLSKPADAAMNSGPLQPGTNAFYKPSSENTRGKEMKGPVEKPLTGAQITILNSMLLMRPTLTSSIKGGDRIFTFFQKRVAHYMLIYKPIGQDAIIRIFSVDASDFVLVAKINVGTPILTEKDMIREVIKRGRTIDAAMIAFTQKFKELRSSLEEIKKAHGLDTDKLIDGLLYGAGVALKYNDEKLMSYIDMMVKILSQKGQSASDYKIMMGLLIEINELVDENKKKEGPVKKNDRPNEKERTGDQRFSRRAFISALGVGVGAAGGGVWGLYKQEENEKIDDLKAMARFLGPDYGIERDAPSRIYYAESGETIQDFLDKIDGNNDSRYRQFVLRLNHLDERELSDKLKKAANVLIVPNRVIPDEDLGIVFDREPVSYAKELVYGNKNDRRPLYLKRQGPLFSSFNAANGLPDGAYVYAIQSMLTPQEYEAFYQRYKIYNHSDGVPLDFNTYYMARVKEESKDHAQVITLRRMDMTHTSQSADGAMRAKLAAIFLMAAPLSFPQLSTYRPNKVNSSRQPKKPMIFSDSESVAHYYPLAEGKGLIITFNRLGFNGQGSYDCILGTASKIGSVETLRKFILGHVEIPQYKYIMAVLEDPKEISNTEYVKFDEKREGGYRATIHAPKIEKQSESFEGTKGGIDLNAANLDLHIKRDGNGVPLPVSRQDLESINIDGLVPVILKIIPIGTSPILAQLTA